MEMECYPIIGVESTEKNARHWPPPVTGHHHLARSAKVAERAIYFLYLYLNI